MEKKKERERQEREWGKANFKNSRSVTGEMALWLRAVLAALSES